MTDGTIWATSPSINAHPIFPGSSLIYVTNILGMQCGQLAVEMTFPSLGECADPTDKGKTEPPARGFRMSQR